MLFNRIFNISAHILPYLTVFLSSLFHPSDPDLGWYLKYGEYFFKNHQILKENIFSSQMIDFKWVNHSWGTDLISYLTFNNFGFLGLSILGALIITLTFYFFSKAASLDNFEKALIFPFLLYFLSPINAVSFRGQLLSLMLLGLLLFVLSLRKKNKAKIIYFLPLLFALWSNVHGQFILGLAIFAIWVGADFIHTLLEKKNKNIILILKEKIDLIAAFLASAFAVLINPFGIGVYTESIKHFNNPLSKYIIEWLGTETLSTIWWNHVIVGIGIFFGLIYLFFNEKIKNFLPQILITSLLYLISFSVRRFAWPMYYVSIFLLKPLAGFFKPESKKYQKISASVIFILYIVSLFLIDNPLKRIQNMSWQSYCQKYVHCSDTAINYLTAKHLTSLPAGKAGNPLTYYGWGGYMIWRYPQIKPSIDGRMTLWRDEAGYSAFEEYYNYEQNLNDIEKSSYDTVLMYKEKPLYKHLEKLTAQGKWQKIYEDKEAGVFVRTR